MAGVTSEELQFLRYEQQRYRLYVALWDTYQIEQDTILIGPDAITEEVEPDDWSPVLNIGPDRLAFVDEAITFDASRSWLQGGDALDDGDWNFQTPSGTVVVNGLGPHDFSWDEAGLYTVTFTAGASSTAIRKVRVYEDRSNLPYY